MTCPTILFPDAMRDRLIEARRIAAHPETASPTERINAFALLKAERGVAIDPARLPPLWQPAHRPGDLAARIRARAIELGIATPGGAA